MFLLGVKAYCKGGVRKGDENERKIKGVSYFLYRGEDDAGAGRVVHSTLDMLSISNRL